MAEFQRMDGSKVASPITAVVDNTIHLKVIPGPKEPLPTVAAAPESVAKVANVMPRTQANFTTFDLKAVAVGKASLTATGPGPKTFAGPIDIVVEAKIALPSDKTDAGLWVRLFLAEVPSPEMSGYNLADAKTAMIWMRVVVQNRLAKPSHIWASAGAKSLADVIKAPRQFEGFSRYPSLASGIQTRIDNEIAIANDGNDTRRAKYKAFVDAAIEVANLATVTDPSSKGLYWWRTAGSGPPSSDVKVYMTKLGNTFYTP